MEITLNIRHDKAHACCNCLTGFPVAHAASHWGHGVSVAFDVAFVLAWVTAGIYLLTWAMLFFFRRTFSQPAAGQHLLTNHQLCHACAQMH